MKYPVSISLILLTSVILSYYLLNNPNFLPTNAVGGYNWINIFTLIFLLSIGIFTFSNLIAYLIQTLAIVIRKKKEEKVSVSEKKEEGGIPEQKNEEAKKKKEIILRSIKISTFLTIGIIFVFILNYLHILSWMWGLIILLVVFLFIFII